MTSEWGTFIATLALMLVVVGAAIRWGFRNGLAERFGRRPQRGGGSD